MPWTKSDYPDSFKNLDAPVRNKAVDIANTLLKDGHDEGSAIRIAISQAKKNADGYGKKATFEPTGLVKKAFNFKV